jgi:glycosyltransferase involved in cell wall biosynthesis
MRVAVIGVESQCGETGGAENFYSGLLAALNIAGVEAEYISLPSDESCFDAIKETYLRFYDLDLSSYDGVISTKAPSYVVQHRNHICYLVHTMRVFYDMFEYEFPHAHQDLIDQRTFIQALDTAALSFPRTKRLFSIGNEIVKRLKYYNRLESSVLHPALLHKRFRSGEYGNYFLLPGRLHRWKRTDLVIRAMRLVQAPVKLKIVGSGADEALFRKLAAGDERIEFLGRVGDDELIDLYAHALAVPFVPKQEDYGYVTLEAFQSERPVITCKDSGETTFFVKDHVTGFICEPDPADIAGRIDYLYQNRSLAPTLGKAGKQSVQHIQWDTIARTLLNALGYFHD